jgi:peptide/nickel transport system permease protein
VNSYLKYFLKKFGWYLLTLVVAITLNFFLPRMIKGNPVSVIVSAMSQGMSDVNAQKKLYESYMHQFGLDKPLFQQYLIYFQNILHGDFGVSFGNYPRRVSNILASAIPWTLGLQIPAILIGWLLGNLLGAFTAYKKGVFDKIIFPAALFVNSMPFFALSIIMLYVFGLHLKWFPIGGGYGYQMIPNLSLSFIGSVLQHHFLPFISIVLVAIGGQAIGMRSMSIYELNSDYVLYAKLMGIRDSRVVRYVFRNAVLPQVTGLALSIGTMISGALITEIVFNYPGIGTWLFTAIRTLDFPLISGCTLMITLAVLAANFTIEIIYGLIDPRVKATQMEGQ